MDREGLCKLSLKFICELIFDITCEFKTHLEGNKEIIMTAWGMVLVLSDHICFRKMTFTLMAGSQL